MSERTAQDKWVMLLLIQRAVSLVFLICAVAFPGYILHHYGLSVLPVYDRSGNVIGHANYFVVSLAMSAFAVLISWLCFKAAQNGLQKLRDGK